MKKIILLLLILCSFNSFSQHNANPIVVIDAKIIGKMNENQEIIEAVKSEDVSTVTVFKDSIISKKYGSDYGVIIITTKKYILNTFFENFIKNSPLEQYIKTPEELANIGIIGLKEGSKNQPYDELLKYISTNTVNEKIEKVIRIDFIKPEDAKKLNNSWNFGALEIHSEN